MFGAKVVIASVVIFLVLAVGSAMMLGVGDGHGGFREGVQKSEQCQANPEGWWCKLWGAK